MAGVRIIVREPEQADLLIPMCLVSNAEKKKVIRDYYKPWVGRHTRESILHGAVFEGVVAGLSKLLDNGQVEPDALRLRATHAARPQGLSHRLEKGPLKELLGRACTQQRKIEFFKLEKGAEYA